VWSCPALSALQGVSGENRPAAYRQKAQPDTTEVQHMNRRLDIKLNQFFCRSGKCSTIFKMGTNFFKLARTMSIIEPLVEFPVQLCVL